jgi:hypothetical protein
MSDTTPRSGFPLLAAAQAQKHVTHNEALLQLDALGCARLLDRDLTAPPPSPADGDAYLVKATATGDWSGQDGNIAFAIDGGWRFYAPYGGLIAYVTDEATLIVDDGTNWVDFVTLLSFDNIPMLGINTTADTTNKLAVKSSALLFDNIGGGVQAKLNKHAAADTASLLYQTNYSGHAELGLTGDDNFHCKVSPDGSAWTAALVIDKTTGAVGLAAGSASAPSLTFGDAATGWYGVSTGNLGLAVTGAQIWTASATGLVQSIAGGGTSQINVLGEGTTQQNFARYSNDANGAILSFVHGRGTIASRSAPQLNDALGAIQFNGYNGSGVTTACRIRSLLIETGIVGSAAMGGQMRFDVCPIGSGSLSEIMRLELGSGLSMFGANPVIDQNRAHRLRSTTIAGAVAPSVAGNLFHHFDAQGGAGEVVVDTGSAYRHAGQAAVKKLTTDADASYTPRADGRIVRDSAMLTADRKLTLLTTNVTDGHKVEFSRRGSSGGHNRAVYQADGTTLITNVADSASADFIYDAAATLWFQK